MDIEEQRKKLQPELAANNINPVSFLATDYLNHYNEVFMLLEMVADMPDMLEELENWQPKTYQNHFLESNLAEKEIVVQAYELCPEHIKLPFELLISRLDELISSTLEKAFEKYKDSAEKDLIKITSENLVQMKKLWSGLNAIIHSEDTTEDQKSIDSLLD